MPHDRRRVLAVLGPTNTGKTHFAVERMLAHRSGLIGFPLRLLAREIYDRIVVQKGAALAALITGEERIQPPTARYFVATVEAMPADLDVRFLAVDEIQLCADAERGHIFTDRLLHARGRDETMFLGADTIRPLLKLLVPEAEVVTRPRFSTLAYTAPAKVTRLPRRSAVLAQDETDLLLFPPLRAAWSKRGEPARVGVSGRNARRVIFGVMNLRTGTRLFVPRDKGRSADFQAFLGEVRSAYRGWHVALLLDEDPCHTAQASLPALEGMTLLWLPKRSPKLNPMDTLWGQGKDVVSANKQYWGIDEQVDRFVGYLGGLPNAEALHLSGALSDKFWLRRTLSKKFCGPA